MFGGIVHEDRNVLELLDADYTFVNERLARHYGIEGVVGDQFRRVGLPQGQPAARLAGQGRRAHRHLGCESHVAGDSWRVGSGERARRSAIAAAAGRREQSRRRRREADDVARASRATPRQQGLRVLPQHDGSDRARARELRLHRQVAHARYRAADRRLRRDGGWHAALADPADLRKAILSRSDEFVETLIEKLMTFGLGRHVTYRDMPAIRHIAREAARQGDRFSALILGIVTSEPFLMRTKSGAEPSDARAAPSAEAPPSRKNPRSGAS